MIYDGKDDIFEDNVFAGVLKFVVPWLTQVLKPFNSG